MTSVALPRRRVLSLARSRAVARRVWLEHRAIVTVVVAYVAFTAIVGPTIGVPIPRLDPREFLAYGAMPAIVLSVLLPLVVFRARLVEEHASPTRLTTAEAWRRGWARSRRQVLTGRRVASVALVYLLLPPFATTFSTWKATLPTILPFSWDASLARADALLHFGRQPWSLTHALLPGDAAVRVIDFVYGPLWLTAMLLVPLSVAAVDHGYRRRRFLLAYVVSWIVLGTAGAYLLPSMGPCYFAWAVPGEPDPFAALMARLQGLHAERVVYAVDTQQWLAAPQPDGSASVGRGIAAFPSMHVALAALMAIGAWRAHRLLRWAALTFAVVVVVGSVHLGWHYAVDSYAGVLGAVAIWWACGRFAR